MQADLLSSFHPAVAAWFRGCFGTPTAAQAGAWPHIQEGRHVLVVAPTGSGKTLAAFLACIDRLVRRGMSGPLPDRTEILYVSPLKALSNDIRINLDTPLAGIAAELARLGLPPVEIRSRVRTGDTPAGERVQMRRRPPHILVTTPESLYVMLTSPSGRDMLADVKTVIVDEIHATAQTKRGAHLALSLQRLAGLTAAPPVRIGLSATQSPIETLAEFLVGRDGPRCEIVDLGHARARDLALEVPGAPLQAVMSEDTWNQVYGRLAELATMHRTTLVFTNTRRLAERVARHLSERLGRDQVSAHHGSLSRAHRLDAEQRLKRGDLKVLVATASLELGIDIGDVDLVCQLGSPRSIATFLQRAGRAGHQVGGLPKARLFPLSRDELVECAALLDAVARGELDLIRLPEAPVDVLAQQVLAEVACQDWNVDDLYLLLTGAHPYRHMSPEAFEAVVAMLTDGFRPGRGLGEGMLQRDPIDHTLRAARGTRLTALTSGGAIPDNADYDVVLEPESQVIGSVNEDFAVESAAGDVFQLGNASWRILRVEAGRLRVEDARGAAPTIPFWLGEAPGRTDALSASVSRLRTAVAGTPRDTMLVELARAGVGAGAGEQVVDYLASGRDALGAMPDHGCLVLERFFDEAGGMQLVLHTPFGSRINRAWGLALRKRFCRTFNFELQAAAGEDGIVLSLSTTHSFPLAEVARYLHPATVRPLLIQALLDAPMFGARWRWNAVTSLALPRFRGGRKVAAPLQRMRAEDMLAEVFPDQAACFENLSGERRVPDHPLVQQTLDDCLHVAMDIAGLERVLASIHAGDMRVVACDRPTPSPFAAEILASKPYAFLDDAPLEERRTRAVAMRRWSAADAGTGLAALDAAAIARVRREAWPEAVDPQDLYHALAAMGWMNEDEAAAVPAWPMWLDALAAGGRATRLRIAPGTWLWVALERVAEFHTLRPDALCEPPLAAPGASAPDPDMALRELVRGRLSACGPVCPDDLARALDLAPGAVVAALAALESEGAVLRGRFSPGAATDEWCERRLLARIHRYTVERLQAEIEPVAARDLVRFLCDWHGLSAGHRPAGRDALPKVLGLLEGWQAPAASWEADLLPARLSDYDFTWLDEMCMSGRAAWARIGLPRGSSGRGGGPVRATPVTMMPRRSLAWWVDAADADAQRGAPMPSSRTQVVLDCLKSGGASFFDEIMQRTGLLATEAEQAMAELVAAGRVTSDSFAGLRVLLSRGGRRAGMGFNRGRRPLFDLQDAGRWSVLPVRVAAPVVAPSAGRAGPADTRDEDAEYAARVLLRRYGVVFWRLVEREAHTLPPWRDVLRALRRLEDRGEVRGGRFVAGFSGEQFALPEAVGLLREVRRRAYDGAWLVVSAADPLNLLGSVIAGARLPMLAGNRVLYRDGIPIALLNGGSVELLDDGLRADEWRVRQTLLRSTAALSP